MKQTLAQKKQLTGDKNNIKNVYFKGFIISLDWSKEYADYLMSIDTKDYANMNMGELFEA